MSAWKTAESDTKVTDMVRETEDETKKERKAATVAPKTERKPLVLLQVNCSSTYNKTLDFWNLIDIYNPDVVLGMGSCSEEISNAEVLGLITQLSEETDTLTVVGFLFM